jgi:hypothetical protein
MTWMMGWKLTWMRTWQMTWQLLTWRHMAHDMASTWGHTWQILLLPRGRFCGWHMAHIVANTWHILWLTRGRKCGIDDVIFFWEAELNTGLNLVWFFPKLNFSLYKSITAQPTYISDTTLIHFSPTNAQQIQNRYINPRIAKSPYILPY